jgi:hypothetical protein
MYRHLITIFVVSVTAILLISPQGTNAIGMPSVPFGGRVLSTKIPTVTCVPPGYPIVLTSNFAGVGQAATSSAQSGGNPLNAAAGVVGGLYKALPLYVTDITAKKPKFGDWVLGRHQLIPNFSNCYSSALGGFPVPVKPTTTFGSSADKLK